MQRPKSKIIIWNSFWLAGFARINRFPGWGSQCTNPVIKIYSAKDSITEFNILT